MARSLRFGRVGAAIAVFALVLTSLAAPAAPVMAKTPKVAPTNGGLRLESSEVIQGIPSVKLTASSKTADQRGPAPSIELNVDGYTDSNLSAFSFTVGGEPAKCAFGNRFTVTNDQAPFKLTSIAAAFLTRQDGTGFEAGEDISIAIFTDAGSSGSIGNAQLVFNGTATLEQGNVFLGLSLPEPIVLRQGDVYIVVNDESTDADGTPIPVYLASNGGSSDTRAVLAANANTPVDETNLAEYSMPFTGDNQGNCVVRGFGDPAEPGDLVTGGGQPVNTELDPPQNLTALGSSPVTLGFEAAPIPSVSEVEPNNSATGAQAVPFNQVINATVKTDDSGTDVGGGNFEDWFAFTLTAPSPVTIDVVDDGGVDIDIFLYLQSNTGTAIAQSAGDCGAHELIDGVELAAGTYVVAIDAFANPNCEATSSTPYSILIVGPGGVRLTGFNVFSGGSENFEANAASYIGTVGPSASGLIVQESPVGAFFKVSAVYGDEQSVATAGVTGTPCEGGPTFASIKAKRSGAGKITFTGAVGNLAGIQISINGVGFTKAPKVKGTKVTQKGPLANGQTVGQACPAGCTVTVITSAGCSTATVP
jgi:hypothetical protein